MTQEDFDQTVKYGNYDVYPLTVEEYETGIIQDGSWNILANAPDVEVE
jgi:hypothetical protein